MSAPIDLTSDTPIVSRRSRSRSSTGSSSGSSSGGGGTIDLTDSPTRPLKNTEGDGDYAAWLASRCESCESATANPGFPYCTSCYDQRRPAVVPCTGCVAAPANPGFSLCEACFQVSRTGGAQPCSRCGTARANPGYEWCMRCYIAQRIGGLGGGGGFGGGMGGMGGGGMAAAGSAAPPENASYEELLEWEQTRGSAVAQGFSGAQLHALPRRAFLGAKDALQGEDALCAVCQDEYAEGDELSIMPACAHTFHAACVARWLKDKPSCPVCMRDCRQDVR